MMPSCQALLQGMECGFVVTTLSREDITGEKLCYRLSWRKGGKSSQNLRQCRVLSLLWKVWCTTHFIPKDRTILQHFKDAVHWKQPHKWSSGSGFCTFFVHCAQWACESEFLAWHSVPVFSYLRYQFWPSATCSCSTLKIFEWYSEHDIATAGCSETGRRQTHRRAGVKFPYGEFCSRYFWSALVHSLFSYLLIKVFLS